MIDAWFRKFKVNINLNIFYVNFINLLTNKFDLQGNFYWDWADNTVFIRV